MSIMIQSDPTPADIAAAKSDAACDAYINALAAYVRDPNRDNLAYFRDTMQADRAAFREHVMALTAAAKTSGASP